MHGRKNIICQIYVPVMYLVDYITEGMYFRVIILRISVNKENCALKLVDEIILYI